MESSVDALLLENKHLKTKNTVLEQSLRQNYNIQSKLEEANIKLIELKNSLYQKEHYINAVVESSKNGIIVINKDYEIKTFNKSAEDIFGYTKQEMLNQKNIHLLINKKYLEKYKLVLKRYFDSARLDNKINLKVEMKATKKDGIKIPIRVSIGLNKDLNNKLVVANIEDISIEKQRQKSMVKKDKLLVQQSKMAAMGEMIGAIAHQWRQPLNITALMIQGLQEQFNDNELTADTVEYIVDKCMEELNFMSATIDDFRNFFKPNKSKELFSVKNLIEKTVSMLEAQFKNSNIFINVNGDDFSINGYFSEFQQVILNLISNSKDAILEYQQKDKNFVGKIEISINLNEKNCIKFKDNAKGIPKDIIDRIFEPYFTTKDEGKGTGIGLYMSKIIIENNMNGSITAKNDKDGAVFYLEFNK